MRLFLAAELPEALRDRVVSVQTELRDALAGWRWVRPEGIHLTLRFLGEVKEEEDLRARVAWREAAGSGRPLRLGLGPPGSFPPRGRPRVLWLGVEEREPGGELLALAQRLERAARKLGWPAEKRAFQPHLTLARAGRRGRPEPAPELEPAVECGWVRSLLLVRSLLGPSGASYTALDSFPLG